ncbi:epsin-1 [Echeneis naucrates]|uniref:Epsin-1-like n=1 Tax=Echeneis naucrates TaxID=173247 RepID=A0A665U5C8_ECHNA|nr:epsin-1-like [Echeneis naucrates]XP_029369812.1 epsin-1-like [Echeneis naucrates]
MTSSMLRRQLKNLVQNYSEAEVKVREATSNDPWGPSSSQMADISDLTYNVVACNEIMTMLWKRLKDDKNWRHIHKSLTLLEYLLKTGDDRVLLKMKDNIYIVKALTEYRFVEKDGKDQGVNVREKAKVVLVLMEDDEKLKEERDFAFKTREKTSKSSAASSADTIKDPNYKPCYVPGATGLPSLDNIPSVADLTASFTARKEEQRKQEAEKKEAERRAKMSEDELKWEDAGKGNDIKTAAWGGEKAKEEEKPDPWGAPKEPTEATGPWGTPAAPDTTDQTTSSDPWVAPTTADEDPFGAPKNGEDPFTAPKDGPDPFSASKDDPFKTPKDSSDPFNTPADKDDAFGAPKDKADPFSSSKNDPFDTPKDDPFSAPKDDPFSAPKDDPFSAPKDDPFSAPKDDPFTAPKDDPFTAPKDDPFSAPKDDPFTAPKDDPFTAPASTPPKEDPFAAPADDPFSAPTTLPNEDPFSAPTNPAQDDPFAAPTTPKEDSFSAPAKPLDHDPFAAPTTPPKEEPFATSIAPKEDTLDPFDAPPVTSPQSSGDAWGAPASSPPATGSDPWGTTSAPSEAKGGDPWGNGASATSPTDGSDPFGDASKPNNDPWGAAASAPANTDDAWGSPAPPSDSSPSNDPFGDRASKTDDPWGAPSNSTSEATGKQTAQEDVYTKTASFLGSAGASLVDLDDLFSSNPKPKPRPLINTLAAQTRAIGAFRARGLSSGPVFRSGVPLPEISPLHGSAFGSSLGALAPTFGAAYPSREAPLFQLPSQTIGASYSGFGLLPPAPEAGTGQNVFLGGVPQMMVPTGGNPPLLAAGVGQCSFFGGSTPQAEGGGTGNKNNNPFLL